MSVRYKPLSAGEAPQTRRHFSTEDKIRIVPDGLRGEGSIAELCRKEGIAQSLYYSWSKEFMEAGKRRLAGDTARAATTGEVQGSAPRGSRPEGMRVRHVGDLLKRAAQTGSAALPDLAKGAMALMAEQLEGGEMQIQALNRRLLAWHKQDEASQRLATIPGVGVISATALAASVADPGQFRSGREFSASLGLVPRQNSSGGKDRLGRISKMGDRYLRKLLVVGATSVVRRARTTTSAPWVSRLLDRKPTRLVTVAMANKTARIVWAVLARGEAYRPPAAA